MTEKQQKQPQGQCPICRESTDIAWRPFCSKRCADIDLGRWMTGHYAIPADEGLPPDD